MNIELLFWIAGAIFMEGLYKVYSKKLDKDILNERLWGWFSCSCVVYVVFLFAALIRAILFFFGVNNL